VLQERRVDNALQVLEKDSFGGVAGRRA